MKTSIIIPVHNREDVTFGCIESILETTANPEIIVIDNGSHIPFKAPCEQVKVVRNERNPGWAAAINRGIQEATGDFIAFINNDILLTPGWVENLSWHLDNGFDLVGPMSNSVSGPQWIPPHMVGYRYTDGALLSLHRKDLYRFAFGFHNAFLHANRPHLLLVGILLFMKRETLDRIGKQPFDEAFGFGTFEDNDFCLQAIDAGCRLGIAQDVFIHHWGSATLKTVGVSIPDLFQTNLAIFNRKWPAEKQAELKQRMACE